MILHTSLQLLRQSINHNLSPQNTSHTSPSRVSYRMYIVRILEKIDSVITTPHCIFLSVAHDDIMTCPYFPHYWPFGRRIPGCRSIDSKWCRALEASLTWARINLNILYDDIHNLFGALLILLMSKPNVETWAAIKGIWNQDSFIVKNTDFSITQMTQITQTLVNISSGNWLLPDSTKLKPELICAYHR